MAGLVERDPLPSESSNLLRTASPPPLPDPETSMNRSLLGSFLITLLLALAVGGMAPSLAAQDSARDSRSDVIVTRFDWPVGTHGEVTTYQRTVREGGGTDSDMTIEGSYEFDVESHPEGIRVRHGSFTTTAIESEPELPPDNPVRVLYESVGGVQPDYVVSPSGALLRVEGLDEMRDWMNGALAPVLDSLPPSSGRQIRSMMDQLTSREYLFSQLSDQWQMMVGAWVDADLVIGEVYELESEAPSPLLPDRMIPFLLRFSAEERVPCSEDHPPGSCVRFRFRSFPDPDSTAALVRDLTAELGGAAGARAASMIESMEQENSVTLVAEPATLLTHRYHMRRTIRLGGQEDGREATSRRLDETIYRFDYR